MTHCRNFPASHWKYSVQGLWESKTGDSWPKTSTYGPLPAWGPYKRRSKMSCLYIIPLMQTQDEHCVTPIEEGLGRLSLQNWGRSGPLHAVKH